MRQVWMCNFCRASFDDPNNTIIHEKSCVFNPEMKKCYTCAFYKDMGFKLLDYACDNDLVSFDEYFKINEDNLECNKWIIEKK